MNNTYGYTLNMTQHAGSPEQVAQGLLEPSPEVKETIKSLLTFTAEDVRKLDQFNKVASLLAEVARKECKALRERLEYDAQHSSREYSVPGPITRVMIGGLPALMGPQVVALRDVGLDPVFSHSDRVSEDKPDGTKVSVFKHQFFYDAPYMCSYCGNC